MDSALFKADLLSKPQHLSMLADALRRDGEISLALAAVPRFGDSQVGDRRLGVPLFGAGAPGAASPGRVRRVLFLGMGSSRYAAGVAAARLRAEGYDAVAEYASAATGWPPAADTLVVAISATGTSAETLAAVERYRGISPLVAITNRPGSAICADALVVPMLAGAELGGIACRSYQHTGLILRALHHHLIADLDGEHGVVDLVSRVADATSDLLERRSTWLEPVLALLAEGTGIWALAPAERLSSAEQSALMLREGPRLVADACETGDWSHVDVYLTKTCDYRALFFPGSRWDLPAWQWLVERGSTVVVVGGDVPDVAAGLATYPLRYIHDQNGGVRLYSETLVAELIAADRWAQRSC